MGRVINYTAESSEVPLDEVAQVLRSGGVAVIPTDTVYGVAQSIEANPAGPCRIFELKRRDSSKVVPWLVGSHADLEKYGSNVPSYALELARSFWPGGLTLVVPASEHVPVPYRAADGTVALRMPDCAPVLRIIRKLGCPLAATSANTSGFPAPVDPADLEPRIVDEADVTLSHVTTPNEESSTIVACPPCGPAFIRDGAVPKERILETLRRFDPTKQW